MTCTWKADRTLVNADFADDVDALLSADPGDWYVTCGARSYEAEKAGHDAWLADNTKPKFTNPDNSAHCTVPALAVDVTLVRDGKDIWEYEDADWQRMVTAVIKSPHLHSLGPSIGDWDHL